MAGRLTGRIAVVTGGSAGIGQARFGPDGYGAPGSSEEFFDMAVQMQDLKRQQTPADVANTVAFLASDDAAFITGQIIAVDGDSLAADAAPGEPSRGRRPS